MKYCPNCGKEVSENDDFCSNCGKKTNKIQKTVNNVKNGFIIKLLIIMCIIIGIGILVFGIYYLINQIIMAKKAINDSNQMTENASNSVNEFLQKVDELNNDSNNENNDLIIINDKSITDDYWYYIVGTLKNNSNKNYEQVLIQFIALDSDGYNLATCSDIAYDLKKMDTYSFKATCVTDKSKIKSYKLKQITPVISMN